MEETNQKENQDKPGIENLIPFGWKHLLLRTIIIALFSLILGYLQAIKIIVLSSPESKLIQMS